MNKNRLSHSLENWKNFQYWEESERIIAAEDPTCMFCGGNHQGSWCMAISDNIAEFNQGYADEGMSKY